MQEAPVGLNSTGKVGVQDWRQRGLVPVATDQSQLGPEPSTLPELGGGERMQGSLSPTTKQRETEGV